MCFATWIARFGGRHVSLTCLSAILILEACAVASAARSAEVTTTNVIFFLVDDLGWMDTSCYGSHFYETPNIDRLAREGMRFTQAYSAHPRCVPARYAFLTGKFPARAGIPGRSYELDPSEVTIAEAMKERGYATFFAGKWHLSKTEEQQPENQGFDINIAGGSAGAPISYFFPYNEVRQKGHKTKAKIHGLDDGVAGEYLTDRLTDETIRFIQQHRRENPDQPFFVYLSHYAVHTPLEGKKELKDHYRKKLKGMTFGGEEYVDKDGTTKMRQDNPTYAAMVQSMDESLGHLMDTLNELKIADHTAIVFTSDHGGLSNRGIGNERPLATSNLPLRAGKGHCYEGGIRVPLIVKWPGVIQSGTTSDAVITGTDHYPTLLEIVGLPSKPEQHLDGISYAPLLRGNAARRTEPIFWHSPKGRPKQTGDTNCTVVRDGDYKLFDFYDENRVELYNVVTDPFETNELSHQEPTRAAILLKKVRQWKQAVAAFTE